MALKFQEFADRAGSSTPVLDGHSIVILGEKSSRVGHAAEMIVLDPELVAKRIRQGRWVVGPPMTGKPSYTKVYLGKTAREEARAVVEELRNQNRKPRSVKAILKGLSDEEKAALLGELLGGIEIE